MDVDYERLSKAVAATVRALEEGSKEPTRRPRVQIRVVRDLQGEVTAGPFCFRADAARDAGGFGEHARPMDYLLGGLASCQQMWCLEAGFRPLVHELTLSVSEWSSQRLEPETYPPVLPHLLSIVA